MKKTIALILSLVLVAALFAGCGAEKAPEETPAPEAAAPETAENENAAAPENETEAEAPADGLEVIKVGASSAPHAVILEQVKPVLAEQGYDLQIVIFDDYILPNTALNDGELDANYFQHTPYLNSFNASNNMDLVAVERIHYEPFGIYGNGVTDLTKLPEGATILIPADDSNETRALLLLQQEGLIELPEGVTAEGSVTTLDIVNANGYDVQAIPADTVSAQLENSAEGTIAVINGNYAIQAGLKVENALALEAADGDAGQTYANVIACRKGDENSEKIQALVKALCSDDVKNFMDSEFNGAVKAVF